MKNKKIISLLLSLMFSYPSLSQAGHPAGAAAKLLGAESGKCRSQFTTNSKPVLPEIALSLREKKIDEKIIDFLHVKEVDTKKTLESMTEFELQYLLEKYNQKARIDYLWDGEISKPFKSVNISQVVKKIKEALAERGLSLKETDGKSIDSLGFSLKLRDMLHFQSLHTVEDLASKTETELLGLLRHLRSNKILKEIKQALAERGLSLKETEGKSIASLTIHKNTKKALQVSGIHTIEDLVSKTESELKPLVSKYALVDIKLALEDRALFLRKEDIDEMTDRKLNFLLLKNYIMNTLKYGKTKRILHNIGIHTIGDLVSKTESELMKLPYFKRNSLALWDLKQALARKGLYLSKEKVDSKSIDSLKIYGKTKRILHNIGIHTIEDLVSKTESELMKPPYSFKENFLHAVKKALAEKALSLKKEEVDSKSVDSLRIYRKTKRALHANGIHTIADIVSKTESEFLYHFGDYILKDVGLALADRDLSFKKAEPETL